MFDVTIKTLDGRNSVFTVDDEIKVGDFKVEVEAKLEIPVAQQRLIFQGRALQDDSRLIDCGVQNKVVHLVPRPPPSAQREPRPEPASTTNSTGTNSTFGNVPWGGIDMQQAIQDITAGIFNGLGDFTRNVHVPLHHSNEHSGSHTRPPALLARENTFSRLHQEATHLLRRIARHPQLANSTDSGSGTSDNTTPTTVAADCHDTINGLASPTSFSDGPEPPLADIHAVSSPQTVIHGDSPMAVDPESDSATVPPVRSSIDDRSNASDSAIDLPISTLADMLSRHRRLWRSAEPYLERWESMLNTESRTQQESLNGRTMPHADESVGDLPEHLQSRDNGCAPQLSGRTGSSVPLTDGSRTSEHSTEWHHRFFTQISRLLHLHAHMLHLISDFNVISMSESAVTSDAQTGVATPQPVDGITAHNATSEQCPTQTEENMDAAETSRIQCKQSQRHPRRVLHVPDSSGQLIRVRDSIEFIDSTTQRVRAGGAPSRLSDQTGVSSSTQDRRRSQSASNVNRDHHAVIDIPSVPPSVTNNRAQHSGTPSAPTSVRSMPLATGGTAIIRRVDIPIISVNMINMPVIPAHGVPTTTVLSESSHTITSAPPLPSVPSVVTSAPIAEAQTVVEVGVSNPVLPSIATQPVAFTSGLIDPFLLCNSRHFSHEHHIRTPAHLGSFSVPFPAVQVLQSDASVRPSAPQSRSRTTSEQVNTTTSSTGANDQTTTTTTATENTSPSYPGLLQHIASFVSAATNAATSAAVAGGLDMGPFNMFVSSSPIHFAMNAHHPNTTNSSTTTAGSATPTITVVGSGGSATSRSAEGLGSLFGRHNPLLSTMSMPSTVQSSQGAPHSGCSQTRASSVALTTPSWATAHVGGLSSRLTGSNRIITVFFEALTETIWSRLSQLAVEQGIPVEGLSDSVAVHNEHRLHTNESVGVLSDILSVARSMISSSPSESDIASSLDELRVCLRHLIGHADTVMGEPNRVVSMISDVVVDGHDKDDTAHLVEWFHRRGCVGIDGEARGRLVDVWASVNHLLRTSLTAQFDLWRTSPTNVGFGSTLLLTLADCCIDFLCLTDLLTSELAVTTSLQSVKNQSVGQSANTDARELLFGFSSGFDTLSNRLKQFTEEFTGEPQDDAHFCRAFTNGVSTCIERYLSMSSDALRRKREYLRNSCIVFRRLPFLQAMDVDDTDAEDLPFVDASSEFPNMDGPAGASSLHLPDQTPHQRPPTPHRSSAPEHECFSRARSTDGPISGKVSPLPEWTSKPDDLPDPWTRGLDPHPDSARSADDLGESNTPEGWHAVLPAEWISVVAGDISSMTANAQSVEAETNKLERFSDAYIAGMPAKRRKVMQEHARSLAQPPSGFLADCLSDAIRVIGCRPFVESDEERRRGLLDPPNGLSADTFRGSVPEKDLNLVLSLRDLVSERIAARLATDSDFDPTQFPMSHEAFVKKKAH
ncbi:hypothetical protein PHET_02122 [Paragonimus heterotremus]|uniref:Ubiquitin-like domain-containing protein n=1 Tax=Paragonimus heterotremus TaxID=100268 RepID=A0A8J4WIX7_9TREM|nr:hypothetical protein PHET_02122 [Paragonimus heterotremus]